MQKTRNGNDASCNLKTPRRKIKEYIAVMARQASVTCSHSAHSRAALVSCTAWSLTLAISIARHVPAGSPSPPSSVSELSLSSSSSLSSSAERMSPLASCKPCRSIQACQQLKVLRK